MLCKLNSFGVLTLIVVALLVLTSFAASAVRADGLGGQLPDDEEPNPIDDGGDGSPLVITVVTILNLIL